MKKTILALAVLVGFLVFANEQSVIVIGLLLLLVAGVVWCFKYRFAIEHLSALFLKRVVLSWGKLPRIVTESAKIAFLLAVAPFTFLFLAVLTGHRIFFREERGWRSWPLAPESSQQEPHMPESSEGEAHNVVPFDQEKRFKGK